MRSLLLALLVSPAQGLVIGPPSPLLALTAKGDGWDWCPLDSYKVVCRRNDVEVLAETGKENSRQLRFGKECATETKVKCKGKFSASECAGDCSKCLCHFDASGDLTVPYMKTMFQHLEPWCKSDKKTRVLFVGLGGGELPQYALHHCKNMNIEAVELNSDVISVARDFFGLGLAEESYGSRIKVHNADALSGIQDLSAGTMDAVLIDCFTNGGIVPETCRSRKLAESVMKVLKPGGALLQNMWRRDPSHKEVAALFNSTVETYKDVFDSFEDVRVPMPWGLNFVDMLKAKKASL